MQTGHCKTPPSLTRTFSNPILALPIQKKLYSKKAAPLYCEQPWRSCRRIIVKSSFCANSKGCHTKRSQISDRKSTRLNSSHVKISYAVFCLKKKRPQQHPQPRHSHITLPHPRN